MNEFAISSHLIVFKYVFLFFMKFWIYYPQTTMFVKDMLVFFSEVSNKRGSSNNV